VPWWGVVSSAVAPVLLIGGWTLAARVQPGGFDPVTETISALAADDAAHRWIMASAFAGLGIAHIGTALALRPAARAGRVMLAVGGLATLGVAAFPLPTADDSSTGHTASAAVAFVSLAVWPLGAWRRGRAGRVPAVPADGPRGGDFVHDHGGRSGRAGTAGRSGRAGTTGTSGRAGTAGRSGSALLPFRLSVALAASGVLLAGLGWFFAELFSGGDHVGLSERVAAAAQALWPLAAVLLSELPERE
jgi:hypothetical protein